MTVRVTALSCTINCDIPVCPSARPNPENEDVAKNTIYQVKITEELNKIKAHCDEIKRVVDG